MGIWSRLQTWWRRIAPGSQPQGQLIRLLNRARATHLLELGLSDLERSRAVLERLASEAGDTIHYTAVDAFELRPRQPLPLREAYARLKLPGVQLHLVPGPWTAALHRLLLSGVRADAVVVSHLVSEEELPQVLQAARAILRRDTAWREQLDAEGRVQFVPLPLGEAPSRERRAA